MALLVERIVLSETSGDDRFESRSRQQPRIKHTVHSAGVETALYDTNLNVQSNESVSAPQCTALQASGVEFTAHSEKIRRKE